MRTMGAEYHQELPAQNARGSDGRGRPSPHGSLSRMLRLIHGNSFCAYCILWMPFRAFAFETQGASVFAEMRGGCRIYTFG